MDSAYLRSRHRLPNASFHCMAHFSGGAASAAADEFELVPERVRRDALKRRSHRAKSKAGAVGAGGAILHAPENQSISKKELAACARTDIPGPFCFLRNLSVLEGCIDGRQIACRGTRRSRGIDIFAILHQTVFLTLARIEMGLAFGSIRWAISHAAALLGTASREGTRRAACN